MKINLVLPGHRTPNNANGRRYWRAEVELKHEAQNDLLCALHCAASSYSTSTPNTDQSKICSTAYDLLALYVATKRVKSISKSTRKKSTTTARKKLSSK